MGRLDIHLDLALADNRQFELADLIALRQIGIEIVLAVEARDLVDLRIEAEACAHGLFHAFLVDHRQHARHGRIDQRDIAIGIRAKGGAGAGKELGLAFHLGMNLQPHDEFPLAGVTLDRVGGTLSAHAQTLIAHSKSNLTSNCRQ